MKWPSMLVSSRDTNNHVYQPLSVVCLEFETKLDSIQYIKAQCTDMEEWGEKRVCVY